jgi:hypothetical protein
VTNAPWRCEPQRHVDVGDRHEMAHSRLYAAEITEIIISLWFREISESEIWAYLENNQVVQESEKSWLSRCESRVVVVEPSRQNCLCHALSLTSSTTTKRLLRMALEVNLGDGQEMKQASNTADRCLVLLPLPQPSLTLRPIECLASIAWHRKRARRTE